MGVAFAMLHLPREDIREVESGLRPLSDVPASDRDKYDTLSMVSSMSLRRFA